MKYNLKVVFCGTAAGDISAERRAYYAGSGNKFYKILYKCGFTDRLILPEEFIQLLNYGIGLTDVAKYSHGNDNSLKMDDFKVDDFIDKIKKFQPYWVCFNGKKAASLVSCVPTRKLDYGKMNFTIGNTNLYLAPSTSGSANGFWDEAYWNELRTLIE